MGYETLELERRGETSVVRLNRPAKLNAVQVAAFLESRKRR
jgi:enoyl-CoA hydratase/carnithine racemase